MEDGGKRRDEEKQRQEECKIKGGREEKREGIRRG